MYAEIIVERGGNMAISDIERLQKIDDKMAQLKAQRQTIENRTKEKERKARTRRLIQYGALAEKYLKCEGGSLEDFEIILKEVTKLPGVSEHLEKRYLFRREIIGIRQSPAISAAAVTCDKT